MKTFSTTTRGMKTPAAPDLPEHPPKQTTSVAVLPFVNMSASADTEYFSDGMTEEIINALTKIKNLKVTSRTSSFFFKNKNIPIPQIGRELQVSTILEGSVRLSGNKMRITAQLIDVADDVHFWSRTFDRSFDDIFAVQDEISLLIAEKLREHTGHFDIEEHLVDAPDIPAETYKRYLKGRYQVLKMSKPDIDQGLSILTDVIREQPRFALAYLAVHLGYALLGTIGLMPAGEAFAKGKPFLDKAIELNPELPECQLNLAWISFLQDWDLPTTYRRLSKVLEIRPVVDYYQSMASTLAAEGKYPAALHYLDTALELDPFSEINYHLKGFVCYQQEQFEKAISFFEKSVQLKSNFSISTLYWGQALVCMGRAAESLAFFQQLPVDEPGDILQLGGTTLAYAALGDTARAEAGIARLEAALQTGLTERAMNLLILCQAVLGRQEAALRLIEQGIAYRLPMMVYLAKDPILKPLRPLPRFQELMRQVLGEQTAFEAPERKYKKALFSKEQLGQYRQQLERLMTAEKPFLDPELTLRDLAQRMEIPPNHLSQLLNEGFDKNFAEFVNAWRLETFKAKVADPALRHLTLLGLAYESGFNSKTVFNTYFKKMTGQSPKEYWKKVVK